MLYYFYCEKYSVLELLLLWVKISSFSLTFGVNMWAMPSTAPLSIKPRTRKQNSTTYGKRELKYITWVRASPVRYTVLPWIRSSVVLQSHSVSLAHTHTWWMNPKTPLCLLGTESVKSYQMWRVDYLRFREMSQKSFLQHFGESFQYYDNWITKFSV